MKHNNHRYLIQNCSDKNDRKINRVNNRVMKTFNKGCVV